MMSTEQKVRITNNNKSTVTYSAIIDGSREIATSFCA